MILTALEGKVIGRYLDPASDLDMLGTTVPKNKMLVTSDGTNHDKHPSLGLKGAIVVFAQHQAEVFDHEGQVYVAVPIDGILGVIR